MLIFQNLFHSLISSVNCSLSRGSNKHRFKSSKGYMHTETIKFVGKLTGRKCMPCVIRKSCKVVLMSQRRQVTMVLVLICFYCLFQISGVKCNLFSFSIYIYIMGSLGLVVFNELLSVWQDEAEHLPQEWRKAEPQTTVWGGFNKVFATIHWLYKSPVYSRGWLKINRNGIERRTERKREEGQRRGRQ